MADLTHCGDWLTRHFNDLDDPRTGNRLQHHLSDIVGLTIIGVLCGCDDFVTIEQFGKLRLDWLRQFLPLSGGIPSHDTLGRCFQLINPEQVEQGFRSWVNSIVGRIDPQVVALDGKTVRGSFDRYHNKYAIHMVSAWAVESGICLGQVKTDDKSNEITALPQLIDLLDVGGCIVTIDAMGAQKEIARQIVDNQANYVLALKANHPELYAEVVKTFDHLAGSSAYPFQEKLNKDHGRVEQRRCCVLDLQRADFDWILASDYQEWPSLKSIVLVEAHRYTPHGAATQRRYYLSSLDARQTSCERFAAIIRSHWTIENSLHWSLDVTFGEDKSRVRSGYSDQNLSVIRRLALNLIKSEKTATLSVKNKRMRAAFDSDYLWTLLTEQKS